MLQTMAEAQLCPSQLLLGLPHLALECLIAHSSQGSLLNLLKTSKSTRKAVLDHAPQITFCVKSGSPKGLFQLTSRALDLQLKLGLDESADEKMEELLCAAASNMTATVKKLTLLVRRVGRRARFYITMCAWCAPCRLAMCMIEQQENIWGLPEVFTSCGTQHTRICSNTRRMRRVVVRCQFWDGVRWSGLPSPT